MTDPQPDPPLLTDAQIDERYRTTVSTLLPLLKAAARDQRNNVAKVLLDAQEAMMRHGEYEAGSMLATLSAAALGEPETYRRLVEAIDAIAETRSEALEADIEKLRSSGLLASVDRIDDLMAKLRRMAGR